MKGTSEEAQFQWGGFKKDIIQPAITQTMQTDGEKKYVRFFGHKIQI